MSEIAAMIPDAVHKVHPGKMLAYNCSPSFNWKKNLDDATIAKFQRELGAMGYKFQFITLAGFHNLNYGMFELAYGYARKNMSAFVEMQEKEFAAAMGTRYALAVTSGTAALECAVTALGMIDLLHRKVPGLNVCASLGVLGDQPAAELARHGRNGVPLYLLYDPASRVPRVLPELLTVGLVTEALGALPRAK